MINYNLLKELSDLCKYYVNENLMLDTNKILVTEDEYNRILNNLSNKPNKFKIIEGEIKEYDNGVLAKTYKVLSLKMRER